MASNTVYIFVYFWARGQPCPPMSWWVSNGPNGPCLPWLCRPRNTSSSLAGSCAQHGSNLSSARSTPVNLGSPEIWKPHGYGYDSHGGPFWFANLWDGQPVHGVFACDSSVHGVSRFPASNQRLTVDKRNIIILSMLENPVLGVTLLIDIPIPFVVHFVWTPYLDDHPI